MAKENVTNFATTTLNGAITAVATSFTVQVGGGAAFPTVSSTNPQSFVVAIDSELILCSARSGDTFTVASGGRGFEGTGAATHANAAAVTHAPTAGMLNHLWTVTADTLRADVPPYARGGSAPSTYDDEFESNSGLWTVNPTVSGGDSVDFSVARSLMRFRRADFSNNLYTVYKAFNPGNTTVPFSVSCRMSHGARLYGQSNNYNQIPVEATFIVSDQAVLPPGDTGNAARIDHNLNGYRAQVASPDGTSMFNMFVPILKAGTVNNNAYNAFAFMPAGQAQYYRIDYDGNGSYFYWYGDGLTWIGLGSIQKTINVASIGFRFLVINGAGSITRQEVVIDWVRCLINPTLPPPISY